MGRKRQRKRQGKAPRAEKPQKVHENGGPPLYTEIDRNNEAFEKYYKAQDIVPEKEWDDFMAALRRGLPVAFRITGFLPESKHLLNVIKSQYFAELLNVGGDEVKAGRPSNLTWYPNELAWQLDLSRIMIRKSEAYARLHSFLISETDTGNITRQEAVSMIPPLLLDVQPHHKVLDMCAAPGSKTAQVMEMLHGHVNTIPEGVVVANDVDNKRCYMLVHQAKRLHSTCCLVTNHDAAAMPNMYLSKEDGSQEVLKYDRILCDVPCSGDGTLRKNIDLWRKWNVANGNSIHGLQVRIARRGLELLVEGGIMVYSTCSMNPLENEAVISSLLLQCEGTVELVDARSSLPGLVSSPGLCTWKVSSKDMAVYSSFGEVPERYHTQIRAHMFPPSSEVAAQLKLEHCIRILPHQQDTGAFFVAVLKKTAPKLPWESQHKDKGVGKAPLDHEEKQDTKEDRSVAPRKKRRIQGYKEDPFVFLSEDDKIWKAVRDFYEVDPAFPNQQLLGRCQQENKRNIYLVSKTVRNIIELNRERIKIINTGVRVFCRCEGKEELACDFRVCQEGLPTVLPYLNKRKLTMSRQDLYVLLTEEYPLESQFSPELQEQLKDLEKGCVLLVYTSFPGTADEFQLVLAGRRGKATLRCYVAKQERVHYLRVCGYDVSEYEKRDRKKKPEDNLSMEVLGAGDAAKDAQEATQEKTEDSCKAQNND
ncbi:RNA cytosine-C(5)-methyltransferase NSUN2 isoform X1 [Dermacentor andersoni]|uniref:RNA cytosine-C(5)-methyltransferase NSUN2 isoform X1 n=1 Tax=Dermacentor andersoni TaxID=34620 RepID=UPI002415E622|nr:RNA cytosine-C(5)-methyltransferase NSUN2-like isoform X1 [Dermacentor andersoni]